MKPNVLIIAGHDPSGGAGIHADIEAVQANGGFASTLITGLTIQNSQNVRGFEMVSVDLLRRQAECLLEDLQYSAVKIGMTGSPEVIRFVAELLDQLPGVPVVLDPVLAAEAGGSLGVSGVSDALREYLFPRAAVATPNLPEAEALAGVSGVQAAGQALAALGAPVLVTGTHDTTEEVSNHLFRADGSKEHWLWPRLAGSFHGSGCTLASAIASELAHGKDLSSAIYHAQGFVHRALQRAWQAGKGQMIPNRHG